MVVVMTFLVTSNSFKDGDYLPNDFILSADYGFGCAGGNKSPHLRWSGRRREPGALQSHSTIRTRPLARAVALARGEHSRQCYGTRGGGGKPRRRLAGRRAADTHRLRAPGYGGPCPPAGDHPHRYLFTVFAVKTEGLDVSADSSGAVVGFNLHFNMMAKAAIMGLYKR